MSPEDAVRTLSAVAAKAGIAVRFQRFDHKLAGHGGLCRVDGRPMILVDVKLTSLEKAGLIGEALSRVDLGGVEVPEHVSSYLRTGHAPIMPLTKVRAFRLIRGGKYSSTA